ncbi:hypothetical protein Tco_0173981 [Tanacetum coccineum]
MYSSSENPKSIKKQLTLIGGQTWYWLHKENEKLLERLTETASSMEQPIQSKVVNAGDSVVLIWNATCDETRVEFTDIIYKKADGEAIAKVQVPKRHHEPTALRSTYFKGHNPFRVVMEL